jgi:septal ring factor EnvC (AmiA/AmiB activator)
VEGTLAEAFGVQTHPRFGTRTMNTGLLVAAEGGAPVRAVADAKVAMADSYQSYGLMAILDHGGAYYSIYTYMRSLSVRQGQAVRGGDTIGHVGDTPEGPRLGFEIRRQTTPEDPQRWLASRYAAKR